jgi:hypothetical protein
MAFDFDENGRNEEYGAEEGESTGEVGSKPQPPRPPLKLASAPMVGNAAEIVAAMFQTAPAVVTTTPAQSEESVDSYMDEVDTRFDVAAHYRILSKSHFFQGAPSDASQIVEAEVQAFVRERLGVLLSIGAPKTKEQTFSDTEVEVLRRLGSLDETQVMALLLLIDKVVPNAGAAARSAPARPVSQPAAPRTRPTPSVAAPRAPYERAAEVAPEEMTVVPPPQRRGPGRPPGSKTKPKVADVDNVQETQAIDPDSGVPMTDKDGNPVMVKKVRRQIAPGAIPFPSSPQQMEAATSLLSAKQITRTVDQNGNDMGGLAARFL